MALKTKYIVNGSEFDLIDAVAAIKAGKWESGLAIIAKTCRISKEEARKVGIQIKDNIADLNDAAKANQRVNYDYETFLSEEDARRYREKASEIGEEIYEYMVLSLVDSMTGVCDIEGMQRKLNNLSMRGWRVKGMVSNELGKNALALMGIGINGTVDQEIIVLERNIKFLDLT